MTWLDDMQAGSFRGVPFQAKKHNQTTGLQGAHHSYPERDNGFVEHMGQKDAKLSLDIVLLGPDYMPVRDALMAALLKPGPGELVHPWLGRMMVSLDPGSDFSQGETVDELGMCKFTAHFIRGGGTAGPRVRTDTRQQLQGQVSNARQTVKSDFAATVRIRRVPAFVTDSLAADVDTLEATLKDLAAGASIPASPAPVVAARTDDPAALADQITGIFTLTGPAGALMTAMENLKALPGLLRPLTQNAGTAHRVIEAANRAGLERFISGQAALTFAEAASSSKFASYSEAIDALNRGTQMLDAAIRAAGDAGADPVFEALETTRAGLIDHIQATSGDLARLVSVQVNRPQPTALLAYDLYDDISRAGEIARRNHIANPNRLPAATDMEVLNV